MNTQTEPNGILDLLTCPGFSVKNHIITGVNPAAASLLITSDTDVRSLLLTGTEEYSRFQGGCLYLQLKLGQRCWGASVVRKGDIDYFLLDAGTENAVLRALALAAKELRETLTSSVISAEQLSGHVSGDTASQHLSRLNRGLDRTLRLIGNMSDAQDWPQLNRQRTWDMGKLFAEIFEKAGTLLESAGIKLDYEAISETVYSLADQEQLERAVLNMLSNAVKFSPENGVIHVRLSQQGRMLMLSILDQGCGIPDNLRSSVFSRYLRQPAPEDSRMGLGLGMVLIRSAAASHGGTVLLDQPEGTGTRVTMTLAIRQNPNGTLRSPALDFDYAGERDHTLLELSDCLPISFYQK